MDFENSWILLHLLWIIPFFALLTYYAGLKRKKILIKIFGNHSEESQYTTLSKGRRYLKLWLMFFAIILLVIAAARPRWGWRILPFSGRGRDVMIVLDVSKSMNSSDVKPTRLKHAKHFIRNLIKACPGDRFGLVAFAGSAFLDCPLTVDKTSLFQTLNEINSDSIPVGGTNLENALKTAIKAFKAAEGGYRAIVLLTDGDELHGDSSKSITQLKDMKIPLFIVGVGDPDGDGLIKLVGADGKIVLMRDSNGDLVKSRLNEIQLKKLKDSTGGIYVRSTATSSELNQITKKIQGLIPKEYEKGNNKRPIERFHVPLFVAVILLLVILAISERRKNKKSVNSSDGKVILLLLLFLNVTSLSAQKSVDKKSPALLPLAKTILPADKKKITISKELTAVDLYNKALKLHGDNKIQEAAKFYNKAINRSDGSPEVRGKSFQNLGVIAHGSARAIMQKDQDKALGLLNKSEIMYREAMRSDTRLKRVILNQQKLLDDRVLVKKIKKMREEMKKKQEEAQKKTKEALDEQKKQNKKEKEKKKKEDKKEQKKEEKKENKCNKSKDSKKDKSSQEKKKQDKKKQKEKSSQKNGKNGEENKSSQKLKEAQKAVDDLQKEAKKRGAKKLEESAKKAKEELKKAEKEQKLGDGKKSEKHIEKALDKLGKAKKDKDKKGKQDKGKDNKDKSKENKKDSKGAKKKGNKKLDKGEPKEGQKGTPKDKKEQEIDPRQAKAILEMMANDEKNLRDAIKENQKNNSKLRKVLKDW